jgi:hypothetical protein
MNKIRITRKDNGAGLGDTMAQVNYIYRMAEKINAEYVHVPFVSATHDQNYDILLGLEKYPIVKKPDDITEDITIERLFSKYYSGELKFGILYQVAYDYVNANLFFEKFSLKELNYFPWRSYFEVDDAVGKIECLIHLRFGDSFCYPLSYDYYFDARNKNIIHYNNQNTTRYIWGLRDIENCLNYYRSIGQNVTIISDGVDSAIRSLAWHNYGNGFPLMYVKDVVNKTWLDANKIVTSYGLEIQVNNLSADVNKVVNAEKIIATEGSFVRQINHFLKTSPVDVIDLKSFRS